jgi:hypothetical protein
LLFALAKAIPKAAVLKPQTKNRLVKNTVLINIIALTNSIFYDSNHGMGKVAMKQMYVVSEKLG